MSSLLLLFSKYGKKKSVSSGPTTLFYDTFTGADGTLLTAHTPDVDVVGGGWGNYVYSAPLSDTHRIVSGKSVASNIVKLPLSAADVGTANVTIIADINTGYAASESIVVGRLTDGSNQWLFDLDNNGNKLVIYERTAGTAVQRASSSVTVADSEDWTMTVTMNGTALSVTAVSGIKTATASYTSSSFSTNTKHGIASYTATSLPLMTFDEFKVAAI